MIITLVKADFSSNNVGTLSTWTVTTQLEAGVTLTSPADLKSIDREGTTSTSVTLTLDTTNYTLDSAKVLMGGVDKSSEWGLNISNLPNITFIIPAGNTLTGNITIDVDTTRISGGDEEEDITPDIPTDEYNSSDMWLSQTISSTGTTSTTGITQSNIMAKSRFVGSATISSTGEAMQIALVTYNDDGSFKARGAWDSLASGSSITYTDENPFNVVIATKATNTSYTVEEMIAMLNIVGTSEDSLWDGTIYSNSTSYWVRQSMDSSGNIITSDNATYNRSNLMAISKFTESIKITAKSIKLMTAIITYDAGGNFLARSAWSTPGVGESITYSDANPFNVIIASNAESNYSLEEMLALIDVRSAE